METMVKQKIGALMAFNRQYMINLKTVAVSPGFAAPLALIALPVARHRLPPSTPHRLRAGH
jgi:hypothetical protein